MKVSCKHQMRTLLIALLSLGTRCMEFPLEEPDQTFFCDWKLFTVACDGLSNNENV